MDRFDPKTGLAVNCMNCIHLDAMTLITCAAFPEGIPTPIISGDIQHDRPIEGDNGVRFKPDLTIKQDDDTPLTAQEAERLVRDNTVVRVDHLLLAPKYEQGRFSGLFRSGAKLYNYTLTLDGRFDCQHLQPHRFDSYIAGLVLGDVAPYLPEEAIAPAVQGELVRLSQQLSLKE